MKKIRIVEVGPRDGLQNEALAFSVSQKFQLIRKLSEAGIKYIEAGAFVSPSWVPQMADSKALMKKILKLQKQKKINPKIQFSTLVPNLFGMQEAVSIGVKEVALFTAATESFTERNINCSIKESLKRFEPVVALAKKNKIKVRAYLSTVFGCPYEGKVNLNRVLRLTEKLLDMGAYEVSLGDTIGVANPTQVKQSLDKLLKVVSKNKIALHFHDTRGMALANIATSLDYGIRIFDSSIGGLGGCPYASGASGNVATEDVVHMLECMGYSTGVDLEKLTKTTHFLEKLMGRQLSSKLARVKI